MKTNTLVAVLAGLASSASALATSKPVMAPANEIQTTDYPDGLPKGLYPEANDSLSKRDGIEGVFLCTDRNFGGHCVHVTAPMYKCVNLGGDLNDLVSSVGPDQHNYCLFYGNYNCQDTEGHFGATHPGYTDLSAGDVVFNDKISSFSCSPF